MVVATMSVRTRLATIALFVTATLALVACGGGSPSTLDTHGSSAKEIAGTWWLMFGLAVFVYVVVAGFILAAVVRGRRGTARPSRISDNAFVWVGGIIVPAMILIVLGVVTIDTGRALRQPSKNPLVIDVASKQWWWAVTYPQQGVTTANEIHLPVGEPIEVRLTSDNVLHSFWVPELAGKMDAIPGQVNTLRFTAERTGTYLGLCGEFCGLQHANMHFQVIAQSPADFAAWATQQAQPEGDPSSDLQEQGEVVFLRSSCAGCHTVRGTPAMGTRGPDLTHLATRHTIGAVTIENTEPNLGRWIENAGSIKPGVLMPPGLLSKQELQAVLAYLERT
jgi:cytochrome c oxidase subunit 2